VFLCDLLRQCSWENYATYNAILADLRPMLEAVAGIKTVRLIDAHSFCWIFASLLRLEAEGALTNGGGGKDAGRVLGGREKSIIASGSPSRTPSRTPMARPSSGR